MFDKNKIIKGLIKAAAIARCRHTAGETSGTTRKFWIERAKGKPAIYRAKRRPRGTLSCPLSTRHERMHGSLNQATQLIVFIGVCRVIQVTRVTDSRVYFEFNK